MCYSAKVRAEYREYVKEFGATLSLQQAPTNGLFGCQLAN